MPPQIKSEMSGTGKWSCSTLQDGFDQLLSEAAQVDAEEDALLRSIEDLQGFGFNLWWFYSISYVVLIIIFQTSCSFSSSQELEKETQLPPQNAPYLIIMISLFDLWLHLLVFPSRPSRLHNPVCPGAISFAGRCCSWSGGGWCFKSWAGWDTSSY